MAQQPCDVCGKPVEVNAVSPSECLCSQECADKHYGLDKEDEPVRNTVEYPVTQEEEIAALDAAIEYFESLGSFGDIRPVALRGLKERVFKPKKFPSKEEIERVKKEGPPISLGI